MFTTYLDTDVIVAPVSNNARKGTASAPWWEFPDDLATWAVRRIWRSAIFPRKVGMAGQSIDTSSPYVAAPSDAGRWPIVFMEKPPAPKRSVPTT